MMKILIFLVLATSAFSARLGGRVAIEHPAFAKHSPKIVGGNEASPHQFKHQVAVYLGNAFCGGSYIKPRYVLTAAHCGVASSSATVLFGAHRISEWEPSQVTINSEYILVHPEYDSSRLRNDVALIKLQGEAPLNENIQLIGLAPPNSPDYSGAGAQASGWGKDADSAGGISSVLRFVDIMVISNGECRNTYGDTVYDGLICTSGNSARGVCSGDSGGPLVVGGTLVGVTSFVAAAGCQNGLPSGFSRVSYHNNWINQNSP